MLRSVASLQLWFRLKGTNRICYLGFWMGIFRQMRRLRVLFHLVSSLLCGSLNFQKHLKDFKTILNIYFHPFKCVVLQLLGEMFNFVCAFI